MASYYALVLARACCKRQNRRKWENKIWHKEKCPEVLIGSSDMSLLILDPFLVVVLLYLTEQGKVKRFVSVRSFSSSWHGKQNNMSGVCLSDFFLTWQKLQSSGKRTPQLKKKKSCHLMGRIHSLKKWLMWEDPAHSEWCCFWAGGPIFYNEVVRTSHMKQASKRKSSIVSVCFSISLQVPAQLESCLDFSLW